MVRDMREAMVPVNLETQERSRMKTETGSVECAGLREGVREVRTREQAHWLPPGACCLGDSKRPLRKDPAFSPLLRPWDKVQIPPLQSFSPGFLLGNLDFCQQLAE